jgi:hypothetical protein
MHRYVVEVASTGLSAIDALAAAIRRIDTEFVAEANDKVGLRCLALCLTLSLVLRLCIACNLFLHLFPYLSVSVIVRVCLCHYLRAFAPVVAAVTNLCPSLTSVRCLLVAVQAEDRVWECGCTALALLRRGSVVSVAHVGDTRAVLCRGRRAMDLTVDHTPEVRHCAWV